MAIERFFYSDLREKKTILDREQANGKTVINDDFATYDGLGNKTGDTDGKSGTLIFDIVIDIPDPDYLRLKELAAKKRTMTAAELAEYIELRDGL